MADKTRQVEHYTATIPDKVGEGAQVLGALRDAGVNLIAFWGYPSGKVKAQLEFIPENGAAFVAAAKRAKLRLRKSTRALRRLSPGHEGDPGLDAYRRAEGSHVVRNIPQHAVPRALPPSGLSSVRLRRFLAYARLLQPRRLSVSSRETDAAKEAGLGACGTRALADRLAADESQQPYHAVRSLNRSRSAK